ncbi:hypothetical protein U6W55_12340, partial [Cutibacterium acnes]|uniref:hypothetical protein n=1 Tax=Cutibacterium acnes TaxID=1747 RepID=UPI0020436ACD
VVWLFGPEVGQLVGARCGEGSGLFGRISSAQTRCSKKTPTVCEPTNYCPRCDALTCPVCT